MPERGAGEIARITNTTLTIGATNNPCIANTIPSGASTNVAIGSIPTRGNTIGYISTMSSTITGNINTADSDTMNKITTDSKCMEMRSRETKIKKRKSKPSKYKRVWTLLEKRTKKPPFK